jgi:hypothetical protein
MGYADEQRQRNGHRSSHGLGALQRDRPRYQLARDNVEVGRDGQRQCDREAGRHHRIEQSPEGWFSERPPPDAQRADPHPTVPISRIGCSTMPTASAAPRLPSSASSISRHRRAVTIAYSPTTKQRVAPDQYEQQHDTPLSVDIPSDRGRSRPVTHREQLLKSRGAGCTAWRNPRCGSKARRE